MKTKLLISLILLVVFSACSETPSAPEPEPEPEETVAGLYFIHGEQVNLTYDFPWPSWGGDEVILSRDTIETSFTFEIKLIEDRQDTVQLFGLHGANDGNRFVYYPDCTDTPSTCAYGKLISNNSVLEVELSHPTGTYTATGSLENGEMILDAHFEYRSIGIDYSLKGVKVEP